MRTRQKRFAKQQRPGAYLFSFAGIAEKRFGHHIAVWDRMKKSTELASKLALDRPRFWSEVVSKKRKNSNARKGSSLSRFTLQYKISMKYVCSSYPRLRSPSESGGSIGMASTWILTRRSREASWCVCTRTLRTYMYVRASTCLRSWHLHSSVKFKKVFW